MVDKNKSESCQFIIQIVISGYRWVVVYDVIAQYDTKQLVVNELGDS